MFPRSWLVLLALSLGCTEELAGPSQRAVVEVGPDRTVEVGSPASLDGLVSPEPGGSGWSYEWRILVQPPGAEATLANRYSRSAELIPEQAGVYVLQLAVREGERPPVIALLRVNAVAREGQPVVVSPPISPCVPRCEGKQCGDDGCGGSCGGCGAGSCLDDGQCVYKCARCSNNYGCRKALFLSDRPDCSTILPSSPIAYETVCGVDACGCKLGAGGGDDLTCSTECGQVCLSISPDPRGRG